MPAAIHLEEESIENLARSQQEQLAIYQKMLAQADNHVKRLKDAVSDAESPKEINHPTDLTTIEHERLRIAHEQIQQLERSHNHTVRTLAEARGNLFVEAKDIAAQEIVRAYELLARAATEFTAEANTQKRHRLLTRFKELDSNLKQSQPHIVDYHASYLALKQFSSSEDYLNLCSELEAIQGLQNDYMYTMMNGVKLHNNNYKKAYESAYERVVGAKPSAFSQITAAKRKSIEASFTKDEQFKLEKLQKKVSDYKQQFIQAILSLPAPFNLKDEKSFGHLNDEISSCLVDRGPSCLSSGKANDRRKYSFTALQQLLEAKGFLTDVDKTFKAASTNIEQTLISPKQYLQKQAKELDQVHLKAFYHQQIEVIKIRTKAYQTFILAEEKAQYQQLEHSFHELSCVEPDLSLAKVTDKLQLLQALQQQVEFSIKHNEQQAKQQQEKIVEHCDAIQHNAFAKLAKNLDNGLVPVRDVLDSVHAVDEEHQSFIDKHKKLIEAIDQSKKQLFERISGPDYELARRQEQEASINQAKDYQHILDELLAKLNSGLKQQYDLPIDQYPVFSKHHQTLEHWLPHLKAFSQQLLKQVAQVDQHLAVVQQHAGDHHELLAKLKAQAKALKALQANFTLIEDKAISCHFKVKKRVGDLVHFYLNDMQLMLYDNRPQAFLKSVHLALSWQYLKIRDAANSDPRIDIHDKNHYRDIFNACQQEATEKWAQVNDMLARLKPLEDLTTLSVSPPQKLALQQQHSTLYQALISYQQQLAWLLTPERQTIDAIHSSLDTYFNHLTVPTFTDPVQRDQAWLDYKAMLLKRPVGVDLLAVSKVLKQEDERFLVKQLAALNSLSVKTSFAEGLKDRIYQEFYSASSVDMALVGFNRWLSVARMAEHHNNPPIVEAIYQALKPMAQQISHLLPKESRVFLHALREQTRLSPNEDAPLTDALAVDHPTGEPAFSPDIQVELKDYPRLLAVQNALRQTDGVEQVVEAIDQWFSQHIALSPVLPEEASVLTSAAIEATFQPLIKMSTQLSLMVSASLLHVYPSKPRDLLLEQWLKVIEALQHQNNYHAIDAIIHAFKEPGLSDLLKNHVISEEHQQRLAHYERQLHLHQSVLSRQAFSGEKSSFYPAFRHLQLNLVNGKEYDVASWQPMLHTMQMVQALHRDKPPVRLSALSQAFAHLSTNFTGQTAHAFIQQANKISRIQLHEQAFNGAQSSFYQDKLIVSYQAAATEHLENYAAQRDLIKNPVLYTLIAENNWLLNAEASVSDYQKLNDCLFRPVPIAEVKRLLKQVICSSDSNSQAFPVSTKQLQAIQDYHKQAYYHQLLENPVLKELVKNQSLKSTSFWRHFSDDYRTKAKLILLNQAIDQPISDAQYQQRLADVGIHLSLGHITKIQEKNAEMRQERLALQSQIDQVQQQSTDGSRLQRWSTYAKENPVKSALMVGGACLLFKPVLAATCVVAGVEAVMAQRSTPAP